MVEVKTLTEYSIFSQTLTDPRQEDTNILEDIHELKEARMPDAPSWGRDLTVFYAVRDRPPTEAELRRKSYVDKDRYYCYNRLLFNVMQRDEVGVWGSLLPKRTTTSMPPDDVQGRTVYDDTASLSPTLRMKLGFLKHRFRDCMDPLDKHVGYQKCEGGVKTHDLSGVKPYALIRTPYNSGSIIGSRSSMVARRGGSFYPPSLVYPAVVTSYEQLRALQYDRCWRLCSVDPRCEGFRYNIYIGTHTLYGIH